MLVSIFYGREHRYEFKDTHYFEDDTSEAAMLAFAKDNVLEDDDLVAVKWEHDGCVHAALASVHYLSGAAKDFWRKFYRIDAEHPPASIERPLSLSGALPSPETPIVVEGICTWRVPGTAVRGMPCIYCGHTDYVHPGVPNPSLTSCLTCEVQALLMKRKAKKDGKKP